MQRPSSSTSFPSGVDNTGRNGHDVEMQNNGAQEHTSLELLSKGEDIFIRIDTKTMLCNIMATLDAKAELDFTEIDCGQRGVRFAIKIKSTALTQEPGNATRYSVHLGEPSNNINSAQNNAAAKVFEFMEQNHQIKIGDFSSRLVQRYERNYTYRIMFATMGCLERVMLEWDLILEKCEELTNEILEKQKNEFYLGTLSAIGEVYAAAINPVKSILDYLNSKTDEVRTKIDEVVEQREIQGHKRIELYQISENMAGHREVQLGSKDVLDYALQFLGLAKASYTNRPAPDGMVHSSVTFFIPSTVVYKHGGNMKLSGKGRNCQEAEEQVAFEALLFIKNNFKIDIADYNYAHRKEITKFEETSLEILEAIFKISDEVKLMWGRLANVIESQKLLLQCDPTSIFLGASSPGQVHAFKVSAEAVAQAMKNSTNAYNLCMSDFELLNKWKWTVIRDKFSLPC